MSQPSFFKRLVVEPPVLFPVAALFHLFLLVRAIVDFSGEPISSPVWLTALWYGIAFTLTIFICLLRRWAAFAYILLTILGLVLRYFAKDETLLILGTTLFPFDVLVSVFLFFFYKRFR